jgi:hypothetical protein
MMFGAAWMRTKLREVKKAALAGCSGGAHPAGVRGDDRQANRRRLDAPCFTMSALLVVVMNFDSLPHAIDVVRIAVGKGIDSGATFGF